MVNNRLKVFGGEGTYMTSVGDELIRQGHDVQYFGLKDPDGIHGNRFDIYAQKSNNPFKLVKNNHNRKQFAKILDTFKPDIIHINLLYFTLTPIILTEAKKRNIPIVQTIHDGKMVCPSYQLFIHKENKPCTLCANGDFKNCVRHNCHKNSKALSYIAYYESVYNRKKGYYDLISEFIFPSRFMRDLHVRFGLPIEKTKVLCNFSRIEKRLELSNKKEKYVLFFGRVTRTKGIDLILEAARALPNINFIIAGQGDMEFLFRELPNCKTTGFLQKSSLTKLIEEAYISIFPSICLENCPMSLAESVSLGTPVLGAKIGGIPELIEENKNGLTFAAMDSKDFIDKIQYLFNHEELVNRMSKECLSCSFLSCEEYTRRIVEIYTNLVRNKKCNNKA